MDDFGSKTNFAQGSWQEFARDLFNDRRDDVIGDWFFPSAKEGGQMANQLLMDYYEPSSRVAGLKAAGINPLTAASGIAGSQSQSPTPASSVNPIGDIAGAVGAIAGAGDSVSSAVSTIKKLDPEIDELRARAAEELGKLGLDKANTDAVLTDNKYRGENWEAELNIKRQQYSNLKQELSNMKARHREIMTHCDEMISQIELNGSQKDYFDTMQLKIQEDLRWQKELNDFRINNKLFITESGFDGYYYNLLLNDASDSDAQAFIDSYARYRGSVQSAISSAEWSAEAQYTNEIAFARKNGENASDIVYNRYGNMWNFFGAIQNMLGKHGQKLMTDIDTFASNDDASNIRRSLTDALNKLYEQYDADPSQAPSIRKKIVELHSVLQLSNSELLDYAKRNK